MKNLVLSVMILNLVSCGNRNSQNIHPTSASLQTISTIDRKSKIIIDDPSNYSKVFLDEFTASNSKESIQLIGNTIIVGSDTTSFPGSLAIDKTYTFKAIKDNQQYELKVKRMNLTTLNFNFNLYENDHLLYADKGDAHLGARFYLASEMDQDEQNGEGYGSYEYWQRKDDCWLSIRIGMDKDRNGKERAKVTFGCNDPSKRSLDCGHCPTMRTE